MQLHPALSFCRIHDRYLFLDLPGDRYFGLGQELAEAFGNLLAGTATPAACDLLAHRGVVVPRDGTPIEPCPDLAARRSLLDGDMPPPPVGRVASLAWSFARTRSSLRRQGIVAMADRLAAARRASPTSFEHTDLVSSAAAYDRLCLLRGAHDLCLPHSLALALDLVRRGCPAEVVLGVQLRPFGAHCWVECENALVNDRFDRVRLYTPIRRL
ncbi:lasso peptide biosynthesis B2 protein [Novosphingobium sp. PS1R-30]|uniref:Lasso peptide biosynthesis B2 protein n=1 Tax=Novosphingobium anseongense TaxID=3133436 RepID=A0ABU8S1C1_9SPHN